MLPCQKNCPCYVAGCHKNCSYWKNYQAELRKQHQEQKEYLQLHNQICNTVIRQCRPISGARALYL